MASASDDHGGKAFVPAFARIRSIILDVTSNVVSALATSACLRHVATDKIRRERDRSTALVKAFFTCHEVVERALLLPIWETILSLLARGHSGLRKLDGDLQSICEAQGKGMEVHPLLWHSPTPTAFANPSTFTRAGFGEAVERCTPIAKEASSRNSVLRRYALPHAPFGPHARMCKGSSSIFAVQSKRAPLRTASWKSSQRPAI